MLLGLFKAKSPQASWRYYTVLGIKQQPYPGRNSGAVPARALTSQPLHPITEAASCEEAEAAKAALDTGIAAASEDLPELAQTFNTATSRCEEAQALFAEDTATLEIASADMTMKSKAFMTSLGFASAEAVDALKTELEELKSTVAKQGQLIAANQAMVGQLRAVIDVLCPNLKEDRYELVCSLFVGQGSATSDDLSEKLNRLIEEVQATN